MILHQIPYREKGTLTGYRSAAKSFFYLLKSDGFVKSRKTPSPSMGEGRGEGE